MEHLVKVRKTGTAAVATGWWDRYADSLESSSLTATARGVIEEDSRYILVNGIFGGEQADSRWPEARQRSGLVMGSVQSGKTASMLGVTALAIDAGVDVVVILAGTRLSLWRQTYERLQRQLRPRDTELVIPSAAVMEMDGVGPSDLFRDLSGARARRAVKNHEPIVMIVMKHGQHLRAAANALHQRVYPVLEKVDRPLELLVLDDEADDGSILDAVIESDLDPTQDAFKQIPRHIVDLWADRAQPGVTAATQLFATYVAYTATPQANFLQVDQNPLAPRDFVVALRTPAASGDVDPREPTFREPRGLEHFYTGGEVFYGQLSGANGAIVLEDELPPADAEGQAVNGTGAQSRLAWISEAIRAYLVAGAVKLWRDQQGRRLSSVNGAQFETEAQVKQACPEPHTMLLHPSPGVSDHFSALAEILEWARDLSSAEAAEAVSSGCRELSEEVLTHEIKTNESGWRRWLDSYDASAHRVATEFGLEQPPRVPGPDDWGQIRELLIHEVIPHTRLSVVNSDPEADDRPEFWPRRDGVGAWSAPGDIFTIFISGNVMSRGLTLEGLTTTLFLRSSSDPLADTQMQMQRWFGYRGSFIELCRVFLPESQFNLFRQYHDGDEALRRQIIEAMRGSPERAPSPLVLEGARFRATGKIAGISRVPLCPGASPFVDLVNDGFSPDPNVAVVTEVFDAPSVVVHAAGTQRGRILNQTVDLETAASILDRLTYSEYTPDRADPTSSRWEALEHQLGLARDSQQGLVPLFRPPDSGIATDSMVVAPNRCPYNIAAYLRLWKACLSRRARGLFPTEDGERPWASLNLAERRRNEPFFYVGLRFGSVDEEALPEDPVNSLDFTIRPMERTIEAGRITATWGSRNPGSGANAYAGDQLFDYHHHSLQLPAMDADGPHWRPVGSPGLLLFHLVRAEGHPFTVAAVGVCVPLGGPDHFAARPRQ